jgi:hypothetical protein
MKSKKTITTKKSTVGTGGMAPSNTPPKGAIPSKKMGGMTKPKMKMGGAKKK